MNLLALASAFTALGATFSTPIKGIDRGALTWRAFLVSTLLLLTMI